MALWLLLMMDRRDDDDYDDLEGVGGVWLPALLLALAIVVLGLLAAYAIGKSS